MEQGRHSMDVIADETGFADSDRTRARATAVASRIAFE